MYSPLDTLIWYHEELQTAEVDRIIHQRLNQGEQPEVSYGKLMEVIIIFFYLIIVSAFIIFQKIISSFLSTTHTYRRKEVKEN